MPSPLCRLRSSEQQSALHFRSASQATESPLHYRRRNNQIVRLPANQSITKYIYNWDTRNFIFFKAPFAGNSTTILGYLFQYFTTVTAIKLSLRSKPILQSCKLYRFYSFSRHHGDDLCLPFHLHIGMLPCLPSLHQKVEGLFLPQAEQILFQQPLLIPLTYLSEEVS